ncbi:MULTISPECIES: PAS domain-containing protein [unclassified Streptomyces]|uniref:PAS domain-containing protein n=1 Tax=unclassified Streptomyces TaxID=2593676 RepID=UPI0036FA43D7
MSPGSLAVTAAEPAFARQFGLSAAEIRGRGLPDLLRSHVPARLREEFTALCEGRRRCFTEKVTGRDGDGRKFSAELIGAAVRDPSGRTSALFVILRPTGEVGRPEKEGPAAELNGPVISALDAQVLEGVARGDSTVQLASRLYRSRQGIEYRIGQLMRKFDAPNRPALVARAHTLGMFVAQQWPPRVLPERVK